MMSSLREFLYYPLGIIPSLFFTARMLILWFESERAERSKVTPLFWQLSLSGNIFQAIHYIVQVQFPFAFIQVTTAILAWRNLNLMRSRNPLSLPKVLLMLGSSIFLLVSFFFLMDAGWVRTPLFNKPVNILWHILGSLGGFLFASRFWVQWWYAEKARASIVGASFFWLSLGGSLLSLIYFARIKDWISLAQYGAGLLPYLRGLALARKEAA